MGFPGNLAGKETTCNARDLGSNPGLGRFPGGGPDNPCQFSCLEKPRGLLQEPSGLKSMGLKRVRHD